MSNKTEAGPVGYTSPQALELLANLKPDGYTSLFVTKTANTVCTAPVYARPPAQEQPAPYFNRQAVERAISSAENPAPGTMQLNDGKERVTLPGGTLRRMLAIIDQLATHPTPAERATLKGQP